MDKKEINKLIQKKLTKKEQDFYKEYIMYMNKNNFFEFIYYLKNKEKFFTSVVSTD